MSDQPATLFGTDGIRGHADHPPFTGESLVRLGHAAGEVLNDRRQPSRASTTKRILIGRDTRESGPRILLALSEGLSRAGLQPVDLGVVTTPGVAYCVRNLGAVAGVVVSASHNPWQDNGIKFFGPDGFKLSDELEGAIEARFASLSVSDASITTRPPTDASGHVAAYIDHLVAAAHPPMQALATDATDWGAHGPRGIANTDAPDKPFAGLRLVVDCANGAASAIAPLVFRRLGAEVTVLNDSPDGRNINVDCGALHPDTVARATKELGAHAGITFDGDADRVMLADHMGRVADGDVMLLMLARSLKQRGLLTTNAVVTTVMANFGLELGLRDLGIRVVRTPVGDRHVVAEMLRGGHVLGGEQSGHVIQLLRGSTTGDGIFTAVMLLAAAFENGAEAGVTDACGAPQTALSRAIDSFVRTPQILVNVRVSRKPPFEGVPSVAHAVREAEARLAGTGRVVLRYSGTESLARVMVEGASRDEIESESARLAEVVRVALGE